MKRFSIQHRFLSKEEPKIFTERDPPDWLTHECHSWWYIDYVLKLEIGASIKSDFQTITRIKDEDT